MRHPSPLTRHVRFGLFEVDVQSGELRRRGVKVKLQEQPFQVLMMLLDRPGKVITREEIQKRLWPANTFVDFDRGLIPSCDQTMSNARVDVRSAHAPSAIERTAGTHPLLALERDPQQVASLAGLTWVQKHPLT